MEEYKEVLGYEGLYIVSNTGIVKSIKSGKPLNIIVDRYGYATVHLSKNAKAKYVKVHRIVAKAFIPNPNNFPEINHKDEDKLNNNVNNLEWCSNLYNQSYGTVCKKRSMANKGRKLSSETKQKISEKAKIRLSDKTKNPMYGKHHTSETKLKISLANRKVKL